MSLHVDVRQLIDDALEVSIVGSFSRIGYLVRCRLYGWRQAPLGALAGRTVLVTGPTSGLGRATAEALAELGARVILLGRSRDRLEVLRTDLIARHGADRFPCVEADMSSLASVRAAVDRIRAEEDRLDVLVDNAGAIQARRSLSPDGIEATFATMVVGPFVLVGGLLPLLQTSAGRVISVVSGGLYAQRLDLDDLQSERAPFDGTLAYARAKRASLVLIREWARRCRGGSVSFNAMHPGWADTPGLAEALPVFYRAMGPLLRTPAEGIDTILWLGTDPQGGRRGGGLYLDRRRRPYDRLPQTRLTSTDRERLWNITVSISGLPDPAPESAAR
jgi:NAD(P)-dependent dehydrogenase (short-subunit alcohol dehydrogenase family)